MFLCFKCWVVEVAALFTAPEFFFSCSYTKVPLENLFPEQLHAGSRMVQYTMDDLNNNET